MKNYMWYKHQIKNSMFTNFRLLQNFLSNKSAQDYADLQKNFYESESSNMAIEDHNNHNYNPNLWLIGYGPIILWPQKFKDNNCLDFACGTGRNMTNLSKFHLFSEVHGADISQGNLDNAKIKHQSLNYDNAKNFRYHVVDGKSVRFQNNQKFHFIFSTIALQHIPIYKTRLGILRDLVGALHDDGVISFQMGFGGKRFGGFNRTNSVGYYANYTVAKGTNGLNDTRVESPKQIEKDLNNLGLPFVQIFITNSWDDKHPFWIWIWGAKKPFEFNNLDKIYKNLV